MNITIVGAGNMGLAMAGYFSVNTEHNIILFTNKDIYRREKLVLHEIEEKKCTEIKGIQTTNSMKEAFQSTDIVFCTYPAFLRKKFIEQIEDIISPTAMLGFVPGYGGAEFCCKKMCERGVTIFGLQRVPYVARVNETNDEIIAGILSKKKKLYAAAIPYNKTQEISNIIEGLLDIPCEALKEYLAITLAPSNPLLHISGLYNVFKNYKEGDVFKERLSFYEEWNDFTSELLFEYDAELQEICNKLEPLDLEEVVPLSIYYESRTPQDMTLKLKSIEPFKAVMVPLKEVEDGFVPDFTSRMFVEDFPFGVCVIKDFARIVDVKTPVIDMLLRFYEEKTNHRYFNNDGSYTTEIKETGVPGLYGINTIEDIIKFYH